MNPPPVCTGSQTVPPDLQGQAQGTALASSSRCGICQCVWPVTWSVFGPLMVVHPYPQEVTERVDLTEYLKASMEQMERSKACVISRRDMMAASAMQGLLADCGYAAHGSKRDLVIDAVGLADELIAKLDESSWPGGEEASDQLDQLDKKENTP